MSLCAQIGDVKRTWAQGCVLSVKYAVDEFADGSERGWSCIWWDGDRERREFLSLDSVVSVDAPAWMHETHKRWCETSSWVTSVVGAGLDSRIISAGSIVDAKPNPRCPAGRYRVRFVQDLLCEIVDLETEQIFRYVKRTFLSVADPENVVRVFCPWLNDDTTRALCVEIALSHPRIRSHRLLVLADYLDDHGIEYGNHLRHLPGITENSHWSPHGETTFTPIL